MKGFCLVSVDVQFSTRLNYYKSLTRTATTLRYSRSRVLLIDIFGQDYTVRRLGRARWTAVVLAMARDGTGFFC